MLTTALLLAAGGCRDDEPGVPRSVGEPSPDAGKQATAERFAPLVWLAGGERYQPMDTGRFIAQSELWFHEPCQTADPTHRLAADVDPSRLGGRGPAYTTLGCADGSRVFSSDRDLDAGSTGGHGFYLDLPDSDNIRRGDLGSAPAYWEFYDKQDGHTTAFVYWLFYGYDDFVSGDIPVNKHEGDWERVAVQVKDGKPYGMTFWKHEEPPCLVKWNDVEKSDGHPVAYSAAGSHGSYHRAGGFDATPARVGGVPIPGSAQPITDITSPATRWQTWERARSVVEQPWWGYRGRWGSQPGPNGTNGPHGPYPERAEPVFATQPCADPLPLPSATPGPPVPQGQQSIDKAFLGGWRSPQPANQPTSDKTYYVELTIRPGARGERVGDIRYPGLDCSGSLTLVEAHPDKLVVAEHIDAQPHHPCTIDGFITMTPTATGLHWSYVRRDEPDTVSVSADLIRT